MLYFLTVNYYSTNLLTKFINSLPANKNKNYQIIIINNSSDDNSIYQLQNQSTLIINAEKNLGFGGACNLGLQWIYNQDKQAIVWIINPDAYLPENTLNQAQTFFNLYPELSITGTIIYTPENRIWFAGGHFIHQPSSITNRNIFNKIRYSTYSYLFTINRYTNKSIFYIRLIMQILKAIIGLSIKPQAALGKIYGICDYMRNKQHE